MATSRKDIQRGYGNAQRPVITELWQRDSRAETSVMIKASGNYEPDNRYVDYKRYYDVGYFHEELEKIWKKQWIFACREEEIPDVGDRVPLNVGPLSYFIVRSAEDEFKAFHNSCPHRGTMLCAKDETGDNIRCPYHAWEWDIDGRLKRIPSHWDFPEITRLNGNLPEVRVERWGGFVFINADDKAPPLKDALGPIPEHFKDFQPENRYVKARYRKLVRANWKAVQEAFMESYHLYATHPEGVPFNGDSQSRYDVFLTPMGAVGRESVPSGVPSMHAPAEATSADAAMAFAAVSQSWHYPQAQLPTIDPEGDVRRQLADWARAAYRQAYGRDNDQPDTVLLDSHLYFMYPQFAVWLSEAVPFVYQVLPHESDPNYAWFQVRMIVPYPEGQPRPPAAPWDEVSPEERIQDKSKGFGFLSMIFDQDMSNLPLVQRGMQAADPSAPHTRLGAFQEGLIQSWHELFDRDMKG